nr:MAG TPA: hypothetical protein [Bacteriophage sp.]DAW13066.1 MAG TPA: hypothetical protein [Caudoviricetes sp.]
MGYYMWAWMKRTLSTSLLEKLHTIKDYIIQGRTTQYDAVLFSL